VTGLGRTLQALALTLAHAGWRRRWLIAIPVLLLPLAGLGAAQLAPQRFTARTTLLVQEPARLNPFLEDLAISTDLKPRMEALVEQMRTRTALSEIAAAVGWIGPQTPPADVDPRLETLKRAMRIRLVGTEVVEIAFTAGWNGGLARVVDAIAQRFVAQLLAPARSSVEASERFLAAERDRFAAELAEAEARRAAFKAAHAESLPALHGQNVQALAETRRELAALRAELAGQTARLDLGARRLAETDPVLGRVDQRLAGLETTLADLLIRYTEDHSLVRRTRAEIAALTGRRAEIEAAVRRGPADAERLWNMLADVTAENRSLMQDQLGQLEEARGRVDRLESQIASLAAREADLAARVQDYGAIEREIAALEREVDVKSGLLDRLSERFEMARVTGALGRQAAPDLVRVIDPARDPVGSDGWPVLVYLVAGLVGGLALGSGLAFGAELLDTSVRRASQVPELTGLPVLGRLPPADGLMPAPFRTHAAAMA
jgi:polysaccharide chain length determinant protein (PEP-CTERM system associated)